MVHKNAHFYTKMIMLYQETTLDLSLQTLTKFKVKRPYKMSASASQYRCIGRGFCGSVWALEETQDDAQVAIKREDGGPGRSVTNDYKMHLRVLQSLAQTQLSPALSVPQCHELIEPTSDWWQSRLHQFPSGYSACRALISERIPKVPRTISNQIVDLFCTGNDALADFVKTNADDDACLIRPYLGRRRRRRRHQQSGVSNSQFRRFSLRNVPLHVNQMEALGFDVNAYAMAMADGLALMHWSARIDANDVEYVLAPQRANDPPCSPAFQSDYLGIHSMWILDFDCCRSLSLDEAGVEQACTAFFKNDPFYPRPGSGEVADEEVWAVFKQRFLRTSLAILQKEGVEDVLLAEKLVQRIEKEGLTRWKDNQKLALDV